MIECKLNHSDVIEHDIFRGGLTDKSNYTCEFTTDSSDGDVTELKVHTIEYQPESESAEHTKTTIMSGDLLIDFDWHNKGKRAQCNVSERYPFGVSVFCTEEEEEY